MKTIGILGSTGSIGTQTLEIISNNHQDFSVDYLYSNSNYRILYDQILNFSPQYACINDEESYNKLVQLMKGNSNTKIIFGVKESIDFISSRKIDLILNAIVGIDGLKPTIAAIDNNLDIALSNKESLVLAGKIVMDKANNNNVKIFPVDSEHSAIWQCLKGEKKADINRMILTASGGPFRSLDYKDFSSITIKDALNHPNWKMGNKITIDSATMMNKGFEVIETHWLFSIESKKIDIIVHPESIIHSMVEFKDKSIKAQIGTPDMKVPINYALNYPRHSSLDMPSLDFSTINKLTFEKPDLIKFKCIDLAYQALEHGGTSCAVLNIANDIAVNLFLSNKIRFIDIPSIIEKAIERHDHISSPSLKDIYYLMDWTNEYIKKEVNYANY
jgi:1-deoxy-D-xylulose-5-phosphate reductoisomerase